MLSSPTSYCLTQCNKIGYYLQQIHHLEIIRMKVSFLQDETGSLLFYGARDIWVRQQEGREAMEAEKNRPTDYGIFDRMKQKRLEENLIKHSQFNDLIK